MARVNHHRWIPAGSRPYSRTAETALAVYFWEAQTPLRGISYSAIAYAGKSGKPYFHYVYKTAAKRAESVNRQIAEYQLSRNAHLKMLAERKARRAAPHTLQVGDIIKNSWGYDQTNLDYYEVTRVVGPHSVEIREIGQARIETAYMQGKCCPQSGQFIGPPVVKRADADNQVKIHDWGSWAHKVDKLNVDHWTAYA